MYVALEIQKNETSKFWLTVIVDDKKKGVFYLALKHPQVLKRPVYELN